jgi:TRAP-type C4-dicarboxylate transport system permease small subunit
LKSSTERSPAPQLRERPRVLRRALDRLYDTSGALAALCLAAIFVVMLAQSFGREVGLLVRGADDVTAWLSAAAAFLALGHTFRYGELVRVGLWIDRLRGPARRRAEIIALSVTALFVGYMLWAVSKFVYESWTFNEVAQGLIKIPIWIPQSGFVLGVLIFFIAVMDEWVSVLRREKPAYQLAEEARRAAGDFSELV